jgi:pSer/pThr/pTyr-binding forkhead associated (FHA) protein
MRSSNTQKIVTGRFSRRPVVGMVNADTGETYEFDSFKTANQIKSLLTVGRARYCDIKLADPTVSLVHCDIVRNEDGSCLIQDAESTNGLLVNDLPVERATLWPGMWVFVGRTELIAVDSDGRVRITAGGLTSFAAHASRYYGGDREAGRKLRKSHSTIGNARHRWWQRKSKES